MNINQMMKQAQSMQKKMTEMQEKIAVEEFTASSGGGLVEVVLNGKSELLKIKIDPSIVKADEIETMEDLIMAAFNMAKKKIDETSEGSMSGLLGGLGLPPGFKMPL